MILEKHPARSVKVAVVDDHTSFVASTMETLGRIDHVEARAAGVQELVDWDPDIVVIDLRAGARLLIPPLKDRGIDVIVAAVSPAVAVLEGCPVYDKQRPGTALVALVEAIRARRAMRD